MVTFEQFELSKPTFAFILSVENEIFLEIDIVASDRVTPQRSRSDPWPRAIELPYTQSERSRVRRIPVMRLTCALFTLTLENGGRLYYSSTQLAAVFGTAYIPAFAGTWLT